MSRLLSNRLAVAGLVIGIAALFWVPRQIAVMRERETLMRLRSELSAIRQRISDAEAGLEFLEQRMPAERADYAQAIGEVAKAERELARVNPESRWATPPSVLPDWNPESPYIWLRKEMVPRFGMVPFGADGKIGPGPGFVLAADPQTLQTLNKKLADIVSQHQTLEAAKVEIVSEHLPGIANQQGEKMTIRVPALPEEGAQLKLQFESALAEALGEQRASLLIESGESWLDQHFSQGGAGPKTISLIRHPQGSYTLAIKAGQNWFSNGGPWEHIQRNVPIHLRPFFVEFVQKAEREKPPVNAGG